MSKIEKSWRPQTALVHGGTLRSEFGETSEAIYLTQGFVYESSGLRSVDEAASFVGFSRCREPSGTGMMPRARLAFSRSASARRTYFLG